ncbi:MAG: HDOD domain-containing protein [Gammaproteobacteria bacterium]|nr:HDOD domain-containing protein [Gammaproteobacteria bacterium]MCW8988342.1 HDOD domain-containing protein [Gammaproteobacteria bacterium]
MAEAFSNVGLLKFLLGLPDLEGLGSVALLDLAKDARAEFLKKGESLFADEHMERHLYLVDGEVELVANEQVLQVIKGGTERAKQSLFRVHTHGLEARCLKAASFLSLNEDTYERYIATIKPKENASGISFSDYQETDDEAGIIAEIQREFNHNEVDLPSMPEVALKINQSIQDETLDIQKIADIIQIDPMIAARAVQVANSAMYASSQPVQTIKRAVQLIGLRAMRAIVMSVTIRNLYHPASPLIKKRMKTYYHHSIRVGVLSRAIAKKIKGFDPEQAFLAGLIHDIGIVPILIRADKHNEIKDNADLLEKIIIDLKINIGAMLLKQWGFENELITVVQDAENWDRDVKIADYCDVIQVAQLHCEMIGGRRMDAPPLKELPAFERLDLEGLNPSLIVAQAKQEMSEVIHLLG